jgi:hypothetical protein
MKDAQNKENIENTNKYIKLAPLLLGGARGGYNYLNIIFLSLKQQTI